MNIRENKKYQKFIECSITDYVKDNLSYTGNACGTRYVETIETKIDQTIIAIANLCNVLAENGILSASDIELIANGYSEDCTEFCTESN